MAVLWGLMLLEELERLERIPRRIIRDRLNAFDLEEETFIRYFRLDKYLTLFITEKIKRMLPAQGIDPHIRVLTALRFFATGSYQQSVANDIFLCVSQPTVSRCVKTVSHAITNCLMAHYVRFPGDDEQSAIKRRVFTSYGLPGVIGSIDCIHVAIVQPYEDTPMKRRLSYFNDKGFYSINVQLIVDDALKIRGINPKFPGSVEDSYIWQQSVIRDHLVRQHGNANGWLLGDSDYPLEPWLMIPFLDPKPGSKEEVFNKRHAEARKAVERCNHVLKARFRCISKHHVLHYDPTDASFIINTCAILHNLCLQRNLSLDDEDYDDDDDDDDGNSNNDEDDDNDNSDDDDLNMTLSSNHLYDEALQIRDRITNNILYL